MPSLARIDKTEPPNCSRSLKRLTSAQRAKLLILSASGSRLAMGRRTSLLRHQLLFIAPDRHMHCKHDAMRFRESDETFPRLLR
jgi:hypothetical protein